MHVSMQQLESQHVPKHFIVTRAVPCREIILAHTCWPLKQTRAWVQQKVDAPKMARKPGSRR